ncbi:DUF3014 domain-containing protein [Psychromonas hadalis]|uniref:DUF3014 domain-containing protein n=1 Tax=Psychromonas hadalis TaxID=211669 RepID=UPI0003B2EF6D|nr:DUF3014 domain-containing protein [Psychromonas hadalis]
MAEENINNKKNSKVIIIILGVLLVVGGVAPYLSSYFFSEPLSFQDELRGESEIQPEITVNISEKKRVNTTISIKKEPNVITRVSETEKNSEPLPTLHESDPFLLNKITQPQQKALFVSTDIIRNMVVFIDNFSRGELLLNFSPVIKPDGQFKVTKQKNSLYINTDSYQRYERYANALDAIDIDAFIDLYVLLTPLLEQAYQEIGYPTGHFSGTFEKAIEHLLETPIIYYKLEVISPSVMYQYTDETLEALPDTQKLMLRMGPNNLHVIKIKLQAILDELQRL